MRVPIGIRIGLLLMAMLCTPLAKAQDAFELLKSDARAVPILLLDQERLLRESALGKAFLKNSRDKELRLVERRRRIDSELESEEQRLTDLRDEMEPDDFRKLADEFDAKVVRLRAEQEVASVELSKEIDASRTRFFQQAAPVIAAIMTEFGASVVLEQRLVLVATNGINITNRTISRMDRQFNDGTDGVTAPQRPKEE